MPVDFSEPETVFDQCLTVGGRQEHLQHVTSRAHDGCAVLVQQCSAPSNSCTGRQLSGGQHTHNLSCNMSHTTACIMAHTQAIKRASAEVGELDGVTTFCELAVPLASRLAEKLGLPHNSPQAVDNARDKVRGTGKGARGQGPSWSETVPAIAPFLARGGRALQGQQHWSWIGQEWQGHMGRLHAGWHGSHGGV
jgi:hypothetical protein